MFQSLIFAIKSARRGSMPLKTVAKIVLAIMTVALIYAGVSGWIQQMGSSFVDTISFPTT